MKADTFASRYRTLVWSNSRADDDIVLRAALLSPHFDIVLDACVTFGIEKVKAEWGLLEREGTRESKRAAPAITRMLRNIERGFHDAAA